jgi:L,D-peptidoglycan transpeptidase YkuD (ErfK/YbiS/YcfS/YnhG family)
VAGRTPQARWRPLRRVLLCTLLTAVAGAAPVLVGAAADAGGVPPAELPSGGAALAALDRSAPDLVQLHPSPPRGYSAPVPATPSGTPAAGVPATSTPAAGRRTAAATLSAPTTAARSTPPVAPSSSTAARTSTAPARTATPSTATPSTAAPAGAALPLTVPVGRSTQVVTVVARSSSSTTATLTAWQKGPAGWTAVVGPVTARIGAAGVGRASETTSRTPAGTFPLTEAFGRLADPGTALPYRVVDGNAWWVSDPASPLYNRFTECARASCPFDTSDGERLLDAGASYDHAVVIDYNRSPVVPGAGSAFFLHVTNGAATAGCVAVPEATLVAILRWLQPSARPLISIGVG